MTRTRVLALLAVLAALAGALALLVPTYEQRAADLESPVRAGRSVEEELAAPPESGGAAASSSEVEAELAALPTLANEPALTFFVSERNGSPVGTAVAIPHPRFAVNAFTDAAGWGEFAELPAGVVEFAVSAPGFLETVVARPEGNRMTVVLDRVTELVVRLRGPTPRAKSEYGIRLEARSEDEDRSWREHATERPVHVLDETRFTAAPAGRPLRLFVVDALGALGEEHPVEPLGVGETRLLDVALADPGSFLLGCVVDPNDRPVRSAAIVAVVARPHSVRWKDHPTAAFTNGYGNFMIGPAFGSSVDIVIQAMGFAPHPAPQLALTDPSAPLLRFRLKLGKSVLVSAESADGTPIAIEELAGFEPDDGRTVARVLQDGLDLGLRAYSLDGWLVRIDDVPVEGAKIVLRHGGKSFEYAVDAGVDEVRFHVP